MADSFQNNSPGTPPIVKISSAIANFASFSKGHGLTLKLEGVLQGNLHKCNPKYNPNYKLDVIGPWDKGLSTAVKLFARSLLPMRVRRLSLVEDKGTIVIKFTLGAKKLRHDRITDLLNDLINKHNDPVFLMEITCDSENSKRTLPPPLIQVLTKASLIKESLYDGNSVHRISCLVDASIPTNLLKEAERRRSNKFRKVVFLTLRWWLLPLLLTTLCWTLVLSPNVIPTGPIIFRWREEVADRAASKIRRALPPIPKLLHEAFSLGSIFEQIKVTDDRDALLCEASTIVGRTCDDPLSLDDLSVMEDILKDLAQQRGVISRVTGFFTFVNVCWLGEKKAN